MESWQIVDLLLRGASGGVLLIMAVLFARISPASARTLSIALLAIGLTCYLGSSSQTIRPILGATLPVLEFMAVINPFLLWWAFNGLFGDSFRPRTWHLIPFIFVLVPDYLDGQWPAAETFRGVIVAALYAHLVWVAIRTSSLDLVESRRRFRVSFLSVAAFFGLAITAAEFYYSGKSFPWQFEIFQSASLFALSFAFVLWASKSRQHVWQEGVASPKGSFKGTTNFGDQVIPDKLFAEMQRGAWRQEGLSIGKLATQVGTSEHRLRRVINQNLGYRNFARFVNEHRIAAACAQFDDPESAETTILSVAYDVGFASLGPFNRAFREVTGKSPSEYRAPTLVES